MDLNADEIVFFEAIYHNGSVPPPYNYEYRLQVSLKGGKEIKADYELKYRFRDELMEEEILEEGFTPDDDYSWNGKIPGLWKDELLRMLKQTTWPKDQKAAGMTEPYIRLFVKDADGNTFKAIPGQTEAWDYFLQELVQGIYEVAQKERYLEVEFLEIGNNGDKTNVTFTPKFHLRKAFVEKYVRDENRNESSDKEISWEEVKSILKVVYIPDYHYEEASPKKPSKPGIYIQPGEGLWFEFGNSVTNPDPERDILAEIKNIFKTL